MYKLNKERARTRTTQPTKTDQSQAANTDLNIIVKHAMNAGAMPPGNLTPLYQDFTVLPPDLRTLLELGRNINLLKRRLPQKLRDMSTEELMGLKADQLKSILSPPAPPPEPKKEEPK